MSLARALVACRAGQLQGHPVGEPDMAARIETALALAPVGQDALIAGIGTSVASRESVPMAFGLLALSGGAFWPAVLMAANIGDDTDTIGAITGAMAGALGNPIPDAATARVMTANVLNIAPRIEALLSMRANALQEVSK